ncbi:hypothetical protein DPMN_044875 [Dreissena polymorpha]|uniref:Uncharacterized protein n=1 Tax=Dreissena polymorpha TaxID=45954 RepID=A0A9D4D580_DREPO|nr:hypothetical protein DPMN_044875 [Dreissena polymorpha]
MNLIPYNTDKLITHGPPKGNEPHTLQYRQTDQTLGPLKVINLIPYTTDKTLMNLLMNLLLYNTDILIPHGNPIGNEPHTLMNLLLYNTDILITHGPPISNEPHTVQYRQTDHTGATYR